MRIHAPDIAQQNDEHVAAYSSKDIQFPRSREAALKIVVFDRSDNLEFRIQVCGIQDFGKSRTEMKRMSFLCRNWCGGTAGGLRLSYLVDEIAESRI